jgi:hypothetical protein
VGLMPAPHVSGCRTRSDCKSDMTKAGAEHETGVTHGYLASATAARSVAAVAALGRAPAWDESKFAPGCLDREWPAELASESVSMLRLLEACFWKALFNIDQNNPTRHTAGPLNGAHQNWTYMLLEASSSQQSLSAITANNRPVQVERTSEPRSGTFTERGPAPAHCRLCKPAAGSSSVRMRAGMRTCVWKGALLTTASTATTTVHPGHDARAVEGASPSCASGARAGRPRTTAAGARGHAKNSPLKTAPGGAQSRPQHPAHMQKRPDLKTAGGSASVVLGPSSLSKQNAIFVTSNLTFPRWPLSNGPC